MIKAMRRVPQFEDAFAETLVTNVVKLPDRSALDAWNSFVLTSIANPFKQMAEADNAHRAGLSQICTNSTGCTKTLRQLVLRNRVGAMRWARQTRALGLRDCWRRRSDKVLDKPGLGRMRRSVEASPIHHRKRTDAGHVLR